MSASRLYSQSWFGYAAAIALTAIVTGAIALIRMAADVSNISMVYLLAVLASAVFFGSGPAIAASLASFLTYNFFFIQPRYQFVVSEEEEWIALGLLLVTGIITGQLAAAVRERARQSERRELEAVVLYDVVRLMGEPDIHTALVAVAERLRAEMKLAAVVITLDEAAPIAMRAEAGDEDALEIASRVRPMAASVLARGESPTDDRRGSPGRWIRVVDPALRRKGGAGHDRMHKVPVNIRGVEVGAVVLVRRRGTSSFRREDDRLLSAVAGQLGFALDRARLREEATQAEILRRTDELKSALLNAVSHDLRTPLSSIIASAGSLLQKDVSWSKEERHEFARAIEEESRRLDHLVSNLLDLSRIEAGSLRPDKGWYDLGALIDDVLGRLNVLTAGHKVIVNIAADLPPVSVDYVEIDAALSNLIENAARHTPGGTEIVLSANHLGNEVVVEVSDNGPGIAEGLLPRLFEPFYRAPGAGRHPGTGLGLSVAQGIVRAHGGRIKAENRESGGARFTFTLPLGPVPRPAADSTTGQA